MGNAARSTSDVTRRSRPSRQRASARIRRTRMPRRSSDRSFSIGRGSIGVVMHVTIDLEAGANLGAVRRATWNEPPLSRSPAPSALGAATEGEGAESRKPGPLAGEGSAGGLRRGRRSCGSVLPTPNDSFGQRAASGGRVLGSKRWIAAIRGTVDSRTHGSSRRVAMEEASKTLCVLSPRTGGALRTVRAAREGASRSEGGGFAQ